MFKKPLLLAAVLAAGAAAPAHAGAVLPGYKWNGIRWNGTVLQASNGTVRELWRRLERRDRQEAGIDGRVLAIEL